MTDKMLTAERALIERETLRLREALDAAERGRDHYQTDRNTIELRLTETESALAAERARAEALAKQVEVERGQLAIAKRSEDDMTGQWLEMAQSLAAERARSAGLVALASAPCDGKGHWSPKGSPPDGPGHTAVECVRWGCDECDCRGKFWTAFRALVAAGEA